MDWMRKLFARDDEKRAAAGALGRNDACWCGSGKKYKACHLDEDLRKQAEKACDCRSYG